MLGNWLANPRGKDGDLTASLQGPRTQNYISSSVNKSLYIEDRSALKVDDQGLVFYIILVPLVFTNRVLFPYLGEAVLQVIHMLSEFRDSVTWKSSPLRIILAQPLRLFPKPRQVIQPRSSLRRG